MCYFNITINSNVAIQITFDGGNNWCDFTKSKQLEVGDEIRLIIKPTDTVNMRTPNATGVTIQRGIIYSEN